MGGVKPVPPSGVGHLQRCRPADLLSCSALRCRLDVSFPSLVSILQEVDENAELPFGDKSAQ